MKNKTAAVISYSYFLRDSRVMRYTAALKEAGYDIDVISLNEIIYPKYPYKFILFPLGRKRIGKLWYLIEYSLFSLFTFSYLSLNSFKKRYKIIHVFNLPDILVFTACISRLLGAKIILDIRDLSPNLYQTKYQISPDSLIVRLLSFLERYSLKFSDSILTANPLFKSLLEDKYPWIKGKMKSAYECVDPQIFYPSASKRVNKEIDLLYIGTVEKRFAIDLIIKALPLVVKNGLKCKLTIIPKISNEGNYLLTIKRLIQKYNLNNNVDILQPIPLERIAEKIRETDIGLVLVDKDPYTDIIYRTKLYEFIACKVPVIATKTRFLSLFFNRQQLYSLKENNEIELAKAIFHLGNNYKFRMKLAEKAFSYYQRYNWSKEKRKYWRIINSI